MSREKISQFFVAIIGSALIGFLVWGIYELDKHDRERDAELKVIQPVCEEKCYPHPYLYND